LADLVVIVTGEDMDNVLDILLLCHILVSIYYI